MRLLDNRMIERHGRDVLLLAEIAERHSREDGGAMQQRDREVAERQAWRAAQSGDECRSGKS